MNEEGEGGEDTHGGGVTGNHSYQGLGVPHHSADRSLSEDRIN